MFKDYWAFIAIEPFQTIADLTGKLIKHTIAV